MKAVAEKRKLAFVDVYTPTSEAFAKGGGKLTVSGFQMNEAGDKVLASGCYVTIADTKELVVARKGITGFTHQLPTAYTVRVADLKEG